MTFHRNVRLIWPAELPFAGCSGRAGEFSQLRAKA